MNSDIVVNLEYIFSDVEFPVFIIRDYRFIYANKSFLKLVEIEDVIGKKCSSVIKCNASECGFTEVIKTGKPFKSTGPFFKDKKDLLLNIDYSLISGKNGSGKNGQVDVLGIIRDYSKYIGLENQIIQSKKELMAINKISRSLGQLDLSRLLQGVINNVSSIMNVEKGAIFLYNRGSLRLKAYYGFDKKHNDNFKANRFSGGPAGMCAQKKEIVYIKSGTDKKYPDISEMKGISSSINIPLFAKNRLVGVLTLCSEEKRSFSDCDIRILSAVANQIGMAIENANLYKKTKDLSKTDILTGIPNFRFYEEALRKEFKRSNRKKLNFCVLMINLDNLNTINDFYGHEVGDKIIKKFAKTLRACLRKTDFVARYAGDEFIALLPETNTYEAKKIASNICKKTASIRLFGFDKKQMVTASIGLAVYPTSAATTSSLIKAADLAMSYAKQKGRNQTCIYVPGLIPDVRFNSCRINWRSMDSEISSIRALVTAVDLKDNYTQQHSIEVSRLAVCLAQALELNESDLEIIRVAGLLHDIGKIGVSDSILLKPGSLTEEEIEIFKKHSEYGVDILKHSKNFESILPVIRHHHERIDGEGYPDGLKGDQIPYLAKIICVADSYQAMVSRRPYRDSLGTREAIKELNRCSGTQFDSEIVKVFIDVLSRLGLATEVPV